MIFEVLSSIGLYPKQVADLEHLLHPKAGENSQVILQKLMEGGKTKIFLPLLALNLADGDNLATVVVHSSQYESVARNMQIQAEGIFHQVATPLFFDRQQDLTVERLEKMYEKLELVRQHRNFLIVTDKTLHEIGLYHNEIVKKYIESGCQQQILKNKALVLEKILNLFATKGKAIFDEADLLLNCRQEVIHAIGTAAPLSVGHRDNPTIAGAISFTRSPEAEPFTLRYYQEKLKGPLIQQTIKTLLNSPEKNALKGSLEQLTDINAELLCAFIAKKIEGQEYVKGLPVAARDIMAILEEEFNSLLPTTLQKVYCQSYGPSPGKELPVPYLAADVPSKVIIKSCSKTIVFSMILLWQEKLFKQNSM